MEFDLGNILYIAVTIIAILASILGKKKKKPGQGKTASRPGFMENLERFLAQGQDEPVVMNLQDDEQDLYEKELVTEDDADLHGRFAADHEPEGLQDDYQEILGRLSAREGEIDFDGESVSETLELVELGEEEEGTDYFEIVKDFDAGTAVVYSAIINRVEY